MTVKPLRVVTDDDRLLHDVQTRRRSIADLHARFNKYLNAAAYKLASRRGASEADREDALQELYLRVLTDEGPLFDASRAAATSYLYYALLTAFNAVQPRRRRREAPLLSGSDEPQDEFTELDVVAESPRESFESRQFIEHVLLNLSQDDRLLFEEIANDVTIQDAAVARGISRPTMSRAVATLRHKVRTRAIAALAC